MKCSAKTPVVLEMAIPERKCKKAHCDPMTNFSPLLLTKQVLMQKHRWWVSKSANAHKNAWMEEEIPSIRICELSMISNSSTVLFSSSSKIMFCLTNTKTTIVSQNNEIASANHKNWQSSQLEWKAYLLIYLCLIDQPRMREDKFSTYYITYVWYNLI